MGGSSKSQVVAYKYYEDQHIVLALSNFDYISHIWFANKLAWSGKAEGSPNDWTPITIYRPGLFGGEKREGGVSGNVYLGMGWPDQPRLSRMVSRIGSALMPAYRGVVSLYFDNFYFGNNPYLKELKIRAQSIYKLSDGSDQWYIDTAEIKVSDPELGTVFNEDFSGDLSAYTNESPDNIYIDNGVLHCDDYNNPNPAAALKTSFTGQLINYGSLRFRMIKDGIGDMPRLYINNFISFWPQREKLVDPLQRCMVNETPLSIQKLNYGTWYKATFSRVDGNALVTLYDESDGSVVNSISVPVSGLESTSLSIGSGTDGSNYSGGMIVEYDDIVFKTLFNTGDINPIHFIRECHTDGVWGGRYPNSKMGNSYIDAADTIFEEGLGVSFVFTEEVKWREIIDEVARHIDAISYQDPDTGLMEIKLIRDDYDVALLPVLDPSNSNLERINDPFENELFNKVIIEFWNRETGANDSITLSDAAAVDMVGHINAKTFSYSGLSNKRTATLVGNRDLARSSRPFYQGRVKTNRTVANLKPGDPFILKSPDDGIDQIICRVTKRSESGLLNGDITLEFGEDIFGQVHTTFSQPAESAWVDPISSPEPFSHETAFEIPYYLVVQDQGETATSSLPSDVCYYGFAGGKPETGAHLDYDLYVYPDGTTQDPDPEFSITAAFSPIAVVSNAVRPGELVVPVEPLNGMDSVRVGQLIMVGDALDSEREFLVLDAEAVDGDTSLTVRRGLVDTIPGQIPTGTALYFVETFYGGSETQYLPGETVEGYGAPSNGQGNYDGPFTYHDLLMAGRFNKPYPPANLTVDSISYPGDWYVPPSNQIVFNWAHRDRVTQSDQTIDWFDTSDYGPEPLTTYLFEADAYDVDGVLISASWVSTNVGLVKTYTLDLDTSIPPVGTRSIVARVWTIRDGEQSLQAATYTFLIPGTELMADEYTGEPILDIDGNYILMETP